MSTILVTGGAGYIGSHTVLSLQKKGYNVIVLDNLVYGHPELIKDIPNVKLIIGDINDAATLEKVFKNHNIEGLPKNKLIGIIIYVCIVSLIIIIICIYFYYKYIYKFDIYNYVKQISSNFIIKFKRVMIAKFFLCKKD